MYRFFYSLIFYILTLYPFQISSQKNGSLPTIQFCTGGNTGELSPNVTYTVAIAGSTSNWTNINNAKTSDNSYTTNATDLANNGEYTNYLCARDFGISYASDCITNVATFSVEISSANANTIKSYIVRYILNGGIQTQCNHASENTAFWTTTDTYRSHAIDLTNYCPSDGYIKSAYFGIAIAAYRSAAAGVAGTAKIDHIKLSIDYSCCPSACIPEGSCSGLTNLPIELLSFELFATKKNNVDIEWSTASEINNDYFTIERSNDGVNFIPVATIDGAGNSSSKKHYSFEDMNVPAGVNYYRLKQTDFDGQTTTSLTRGVWVKSDNDIFVTYSEDSKEAIIHFVELPQIMPYVVFVNSLGKYINVPLNTDNMLDGHLKIDLSGLSSGLYYVTVFDQTLKTTKPILINR